MKAIVEFSFYGLDDIERARENINKLAEEHKKATGCKHEKPLLHCDDLHMLWVLSDHLDSLIKKVRKAEEEVSNISIDSAEVYKED